MKTITMPQDRKEIESGILHRLICADEVKNVGLFAHVTLKPGEVVDFHEHHGEFETYYILKGEAVYNDNGNVSTINAGAVTYTADGCGHGIKNDGIEDVEFIALIVKQ